MEIFGRLPGVGEPLGVVVPEDLAPLLADDVEIIEEIRKIPGQDERQGRLAERLDGRPSGPSVPMSVRLSGEGDLSSRSFSRPSAAKSSQKIWRSSHQSPRTQWDR